MAGAASSSSVSRRSAKLVAARCEDAVRVRDRARGPDGAARRHFEVARVDAQRIVRQNPTRRGARTMGERGFIASSVQSKREPEQPAQACLDWQSWRGASWESSSGSRMYTSSPSGDAISSWKNRPRLRCRGSTRRSSSLS